jgi:hypothetical protein
MASPGQIILAHETGHAWRVIATTPGIPHPLEVDHLSVEFLLPGCGNTDRVDAV